MTNREQRVAIAEGKMKRAKEQWRLSDAADSFTTEVGLLQPVLFEGMPAMLKVPFKPQEKRGFFLLECWGGMGAVKVFAFNADALLMERATGSGSLKQMVYSGQEDQANGIICQVVKLLHANPCGGNSKLVPLVDWFQALKKGAKQYGGIFSVSQKVADELLANPLDRVALHGDIHYDNIVDTGSRGWVAIDPKGLVGEKGFDYANIFCNPDFAIAGSAERLARQVRLVADASGQDIHRLLCWIIAWAGLCAIWTLEDGKDPKLPMRVGELAVLELEKIKATL